LSSLTLGFPLAIPNNYVEPQLSSAPVAEAHPVPRPPGPRVSVWEVARLKVVSPAIDGPNVALVIFECEGEDRFARWIGGDEWRRRDVLHRLFAESDRVGSVERPTLPKPPEPNDTGVGPAPPETVAMWVKLVATMGPDELADFEARTFKQWDRASLSVVRIAIDRRRRQLLG
jgi:hypothetical protein